MIMLLALHWWGFEGLEAYADKLLDGYIVSSLGDGNSLLIYGRLKKEMIGNGCA
jgi:hypothetical protein